MTTHETSPDQLTEEQMLALHDGSVLVLKDAFLRIDDMVRAGTPTPEVFRWLLKDALSADADIAVSKHCQASITATATMYLYQAVAMYGAKAIFAKEGEEK